MKIWAFEVEDAEDPYWGLFTDLAFAKKSAESSWWDYVKDQQACDEWLEYKKTDLRWDPEEDDEGMQLFMGEEATAYRISAIQVFEVPVLSYEETGEKKYPYKVLNDAGDQQGETLYLTDTQAAELVEELPTGWSVEEKE